MKKNSSPSSPTSGINQFALLRRLWRYLNSRRQYQFGILVLLMIACAFAEVISLGAILPFLGVLTDPIRVYQNPVVAGLALKLRITSADQLLFPLTVSFAIVALMVGAIRLLQLWANTRFSYAVGHDLSVEVYRRTLYQPYRVHLGSNSSEVISGVDKVNTAIEVLLQMLTLLSATLITGCLILTLMVIDPLVATVVFLGFGGIYGLVTWMTRRRLLSNSQKVAREHIHRLKALQEGLGGIRDVLLGGNQSTYCKLYSRADLPMRAAQGDNRFVSQSPRYAVEALGMGLIAFLAYGLGQRSGEMATVLPVLGALALGAHRLLPALQQIYSGWAIIMGSRTSLEDVMELLDQPLPEGALLLPPAPLDFQRDIRFESVKFRYAPDGPPILNGLDLIISHGARVGFVGCTGSGKSTTLDLLMGLLEPTEGRILVDGLPLQGERLRAWQRTIAHVPQSIFLADTTLAENIAFGEPPENIDMDRVKRAARQAHIADFIETNPKGYNALVGERGIRLSGGQRQRIGIARALYGKATVLIFDEATSALDNDTERAVMDAIEKLGRDLTILIIAHRLTTVSRCDLIVELRRGVMVTDACTHDNSCHQSIDEI